MKHRAWCWIALSGWLALGQVGFAVSHYEVAIDRNVPVKMRDGIILRADIYRPKAEGKFPVILERTPYDKLINPDWALAVAADGYVAIIQDVRGRFASEGDWYAFQYESQDGYDTVEWAAGLPYSNGKIGLFGGSYTGITVLLAALAQPPHLASMFYVESPADLYQGFAYRGGEFQQYLAETWTTLFLVPNTLERQMQKNAEVMKWMWAFPLSNYPLLATGPTEGLAPYFTDWLKHPSDDNYWKRWSLTGQYSKIRVPVFHIGGWYDLFLGGVLKNYVGMREHSGSEAARNGQRLLVLPWSHGQFGGKTGEVNFVSNGYGLDLTSMIEGWFNHTLKGMPENIGQQKPVKIFVMGENIWREEDDWPLARAHSTRFYLHSDAKANSLRGDGEISSTAPQTEPSDQFIYNPAQPAPTTGGGLCCGPLMPGALDQRAVEGRDDVLVYTTPLFKQDFEVTGPIQLELYASSSAVDTDFTAKLVDVWPNGFAQNLTSGILRACYRNSFETPELMNPGQAYRFNIDMWDTSNVFLPGHRLRLEISSSNFPRYARNPNTGEGLWDGKLLMKATNKIYHDREHPSALVLPVVQ